MAGTPPIGRFARLSLGTLQAFENRNYRLLWAATLLVLTCRWMQVTLLVWLVLTITDSPFQVSLIGFFHVIPMLAVGPIGGALGDRFDRRKLITVTASAAALAGLAMTLVLAAGAEEAWHAYLVVTVIGVGWSIELPTRRSAIQDLFVDEARVTNAVAMESVALLASRIIGPAVAGGMIALTGVSGGYPFVMVLYALTLSIFVFLRLPDTVRKPSTISSISPRGLWEGLRYARREQAILAAVVVTAIVNLQLVPITQMVPIIAREVLDVGGGLMGILLAADAAGALLGALVIAAAPAIRHHGRLYLAGSMIAVLGLFAFSFSTTYPLSFLLLLVGGVGTAGFVTMQGTIVMLVARPEMRGRALGAMSMGIGTGPLGALMTGAIADATDAAFAMRLNAAIGLGLLVVAGLTLRSLWGRIPAERSRPG